MIRPMRWESGQLLMLDQRVLPHQETWLQLESWEDVARAIADMAVRGAPAIGVAAAYGMALAACSGTDLKLARQGLAASRPTAVNLFRALDRIMALDDPSYERVLAEAQAIEREDVESNLAIGTFGAELLPGRCSVLTICNTGSLATSGHGTAMGIIRTAFGQGKISMVYACETRPRLQGLRLTAWELQQDGIPFRCIADGAAASLMSQRKVDCVIVGADRIAANGDTANKIGTLALALAAKHFGVPFYVAAPTSTIDLSISTGAEIEIEERDGAEITHAEETPVAPENCEVWNPAFDVTPGELITGIVTEEGVTKAPFPFSARLRVSSTR